MPNSISYFLVQSMFGREKVKFAILLYTYQLLNEIEHDMKYQAKFFRHQPKPKTEVDNNRMRLVDSLYHVRTVTYLMKQIVLFYIFAPFEVNVVVIAIRS